jgi:hypothetical protein
MGFYTPLGGLAGLIEGALIGGITYAVFFGLMEILHPEFADSDTVWEALLMGFSGGAIFGSMIGIIPGAIAGPGVRIFLPKQN